MPDELEKRLERIENGLAELAASRADLVPVLESIAEAITAMAEQIDALTDALLPEDTDSGLTLDGEEAGAGERDERAPLEGELETL